MRPPVTGMLDVEEFESDVEELGVLVGTCVAVGEVGVETGVVGVEVGVLVAVAGASVIVMKKLPAAVLPASSVAEQLTVVVPTPNVEPEVGVQIAATEESRLSLAEAE